jgi:hypothetical protein
MAESVTLMALTAIRSRPVKSRIEVIRGSVVTSMIGEPRSGSMPRTL